MYTKKPTVKKSIKGDYGEFRISSVDNAKSLGIRIDQEMCPNEDVIRIISFDGPGNPEKYKRKLTGCITYMGKKPCRAILNGNKSSDILCVDKHLHIEDCVLGKEKIRMTFEVMPRSNFWNKEVKIMRDSIIVRVWGDVSQVELIADRLRREYLPFSSEWEALLLLAADTNSPSIDTLGLPHGVRNCLKRARIETVSELTKCTEKELLVCRTMGVVSLEKVKKVLAEKGMHLSE